MSSPLLDPSLVEKAIGFHGLPLQKIWDGERGEMDLTQLGIINPNFVVYQSRQKTFTFHDRAKRFKLHQFLSKKADQLYDKTLVVPVTKDRVTRTRPGEYQQYDQFMIPPIDAMMEIDTTEKINHFLETVRPGDVVYGLVLNKAPQGIIFKVLFSMGNTCCFVNTGQIKAYVGSNYLAQAFDRAGAPRNFAANDLVCCEVSDAKPDARKLVCTMQRTAISRAPDSIKYGLISPEDLPVPYTLAAVKEPKSYEHYLKKSVSFNDPRGLESLMKELGLSSTEFYTNMSSLKGKFPTQEYAGELRNAQASKWAFRSVAEGIEHFKEGRHAEAFQCLNKALSIDARNVEGLVARGALYANSGSFKKAVDDFETALKINATHANARKYLGETLVALGRSYEEETRFEDARKAYTDCLNIIPHHEEAQNSLDALKTKAFPKQIVAPNELELPALNIPKSSNHKQEPDTSKRDGSESRKDKKSSKKHEKKRKHKKRQSSSSESSSNSSDSSDSSSDSDSSSSSSSSSSDSSRSSAPKKRNKRSKSVKKQKSLSPLSKRMSAAMGNDIRGGNGPFSFGNQQTSGAADDYEQKVRKFLDMPRDEDDYEDKVRRFVAEATKYQKERKAQEEKTKKEKKKKEKKAKKESKKKRKSEDKKKSKKKDKEDVLNNDKLKEALKIFEKFPVLDELGSKLSQYYTKKDNPVAGPSGMATVLSSLLTKGSSKRELAKIEKNNEELKAKPQEAPKAKDGKWRMMFNKDERTKEPPPTKPFVPKQYAFANDSEEESASFPVQQTQPQQLQQKTNRRLANADDASKPPEPAGPPQRSRSRSRGRRDESSSQSRSPSTRRRSRSGSFRRRFSRSGSRSFSRSRSRSYSRSRSRSRSPERRRFVERRFFRGRGYYHNNRPYGRFMHRGGFMNRRGGFRDYHNYRDGYDHRGGYRPPFRHRFQRRFQRSFSRSNSKSPDRMDSPNNRDRSKSKERDSYRDRKNDKNKDGSVEVESSNVVYITDDVEGRWAEDKPSKDPPPPGAEDSSNDDIDSMLDKARKDKKEGLA
ncbi:tetratricopeptide repeat protein 14 homolog isoform X2 [Uranotaenia lowii]|uniref:tetratricopeptide repeat protein 14 homolog isoform X2 n=1 Tax=Uranotaenia lowii TaxID=190385 RepID=UPI002478CD17|nr:tetratricopeptide repeat protein 14 homolog isoform X2 [Uranotaenia lowii]